MGASPSLSSANLMSRNLEHMAGAHSEHAKMKRYAQRSGRGGGAHNARTSCQRHYIHAQLVAFNGHEGAGGQQGG
jgi:hypothetical protein